MEVRGRKDQTIGDVSPEKNSGAQTGDRGGERKYEISANDSVIWKVWPLRENIWRSVAVVLFLMAVVWALASWFGPQWILPSFFILLFFLSGFFFPTFYQLDSESASVRGLITRRKRRWSDLKKYYLDTKGVHLSPEEKPSKLESFRGIYLPFGEHRGEIVAFIERKIGRER